MNSDAPILDLSIHDLDDLSGKRVIINGVPYRIVDLIGAGGEGSVYRIRNETTGVITLALKVYMFTPASPEYQEIKHNGIRNFQSKGVAPEILTVELYEQNGGLLELMECLAHIPDNHSDEISSATKLMAQSRNPEALTVLEHVLAANPNHYRALVNQGVCLGRMGDIGRALQTFFRCIELEPNDAYATHNAAIFLKVSGRSEAAIQVLRQSLKRYAANFETWRMLVDIATEFDAIELAADIIDWGIALIADLRVGKELQARIEESRKRSEQYQSAFQDAVAVQRLQRWDEALPLLDRAIAASKRNAMARLNRGICQFHKGDIADAVETLRGIIGSVSGDPGFAAGVLLLLGWAHLNRWDITRTITLDFNQRFNQPADVPRIPLVATGEYCLQTVDVARIVSTISTIPSKVQCSVNDLRAFGQLRHKYEQLATAQLPTLDEERAKRFNLNAGTR